MPHWVYILYSASTDKYYKGQTDDLRSRLHRHNSGWEKATKYGVPWTLVWCTEKSDRGEAMILEKKLKNLSRKRVIQLIEREINDVAGPDDTAEDGSMSGR
jgi:putative endonuclease